MLELYVWGPALSLPSIDPASLASITYLQILGAQYSLIECNDPNISPTGELPVLKDGDVWVGGLQRVISHLSKKDLDLNASLSPSDQASSLAYAAFLPHIQDLTLQLWYADTTNFVQAIRPAYAKLLSFPLCYISPVALKRNAKSRLSIRGIDIKMEKNEGYEKMEEKMVREARQLYETLETQLGKRQYFFGEKPTTLDALIYGHLASHLHGELPNNRLSLLLNSEFPELSRWCHHMRDTYLSSLPHHFEQTPRLETSQWDVFSGIFRAPLAWLRHTFFSSVIPTKEHANTTEKTEAERDFERKRMWAIATAVVTVLTYVIANGIVSVEIGDGWSNVENDDTENEGEVYEEMDEDEDEDL
ncbi:uncharacterized protein VTP21DRAFT_9673 [Calcarisporiella thermophila]|uniref:uncharacterized protein n=1 Tax=Calcarisporiella thermophila TaxID=911321 RepID=UPI00374306DC